MIFVTDDAKEDWWRIHEGKKISPRPELVEEMESTAGVIFYMYSSEKFMDYAEQFLNLPHQQEITEEVRDIRLQNEEEQLEKIQNFKRVKELAQQAQTMVSVNHNSDKLLQPITITDPALLQSLIIFDAEFMEKMLQLGNINLAFSKSINSSYIDALKYLSATKESTSFNNNPQEDIDSTSNQESS